MTKSNNNILAVLFKNKKSNKNKSKKTNKVKTFFKKLNPFKAFESKTLINSVDCEEVKENAKETAKDQMSSFFARLEETKEKVRIKEKWEKEQQEKISFEDRKNKYSSKLLFVFEEAEKILQPKLAARKEKEYQKKCNAIDEIFEDYKKAEEEKKAGTYKWYNYCDLTPEEIEQYKRWEKEDEEERKEEERKKQEQLKKEKQNAAKEIKEKEIVNIDRSIDASVGLVAKFQHIAFNIFVFLLFFSSKIIFASYQIEMFLQKSNFERLPIKKPTKIIKERKRIWDLNQWIALTI